jgi:transposase/DNA-binding CsgD family transcriptional regulator
VRGAGLSGAAGLHRVTRSLSERCRVILRCADGVPNKSVGAEFGLHEHTVGKWRRRFLKDRCEGLLDEARPGRPRTIDDDQVAAVIERTLRTTPTDAVRWQLKPAFRIRRSAACGRRSAWQPHRSQTFKLSNDPLFVDKVRDIVGLYLSPPNRALVLSLDEKSQIQALDREQPVLPMMPGVPERRTHSYVRHGTTSLFAALDVASGFVIGKCYKRHRATEFLNFLKEIDSQVPEGLDIHIVMDNYATHKTPKIKAWLARRPHYHVHFTPTSASWINQVERWFAELTRKRLRRGIHTSVRQLEADIRSFIDRHNQNPRPFKWTKSADQILASVKRFCHKAQQTLCGEL